MLNRVALLEFPDEAESLNKYLSDNCMSEEEVIVVGLSPSVRSVITREGRAVDDTLKYLTNESHSRTLQKSEEICEWLWGHVHLIDSDAIEFPYTQSLIWYVRLFIHELLWEIELIHRAVSLHEASNIIVGAPFLNNSSDQQLHPSERYLGELVRRYAKNNSLTVVALAARNRRAMFDSSSIARQAFRLCVAPLWGRVHRRNLVRRYSGGCVLGTTDQYRMDNVAYRLKQSESAQPMLVMREWPRWRNWTSLITKQNCHPFDDEVFMGYWEAGVAENVESRRHLEVAIDGVVQDILQASELFSYCGVAFSDLVAKKVNSGIKPFVLSLHRRAATIRTLLTRLNPSAVVSVGNRNDDLLIGVVSQQLGLPAMMISHGSHVTQKNGAGHMEWQEQAHRLIRAPFPYVGLQSKLAEDFWRTFPSEGRPIRIGPVLWGLRGKRARGSDQGVKPSSNVAQFVVMHAGTPKRREGRRFLVYETLDEYLDSIVCVARAILQIPSVHFIVKFRSIPGLSLDDLCAVLPSSDRISINIDEPLIDVLQRSQLLISFSSTTIEESFQYGVPVLLYGGHGRYHHISNPVVLSGGVGPLAPVYAVKEDEFLVHAITQILCRHREAKDADHLFDQFRFSKQEVMSLPAWVQSTRDVVMSEPRTAASAL